MSGGRGGAAPAQDATVLIVEDEQSVRKLASLMLKRKGYKVLEASDGKQALAVLAECPEPPDVILLDWAMPAMGGEELLPVLAREYPGIKIVVSSGYPGGEGSRIPPLDLVAAFLPKPYHEAILHNIIAQVLAAE